MPDTAAAAPAALSGHALPGGAGLLDEEVAVRLPEDGVHPPRLRHSTHSSGLIPTHLDVKTNSVALKPWKLHIILSTTIVLVGYSHLKPSTPLLGALPVLTRVVRLVNLNMHIKVSS